VFIFPKRLVRPAGPAALTAAVCVMAAVSAAVSAAVLAADASRVAAAQGRLDAEYTASLAGIPIGRGNWVIEIFEDQFTAAASGSTIGLLRVFAGGHGTGVSLAPADRRQRAMQPPSRMTSASTTYAWCFPAAI